MIRSHRGTFNVTLRTLSTVEVVVICFCLGFPQLLLNCIHLSHSCVWWCSGGEGDQWGVQDLEEEHPLSLRSGHDPCSGVAQPDCPVAARCHKVNIISTAPWQMTSLSEMGNLSSLPFLRWLNNLCVSWQAWGERLQCAQAGSGDAHLWRTEPSRYCQCSASKWWCPVWRLALRQRKRRWGRLGKVAN